MHNKVLSLTVILIPVLILLSGNFALAIGSQANELLHKAKANLNSGNLKAAEIYCKRALEIEPNASEIIDFNSLLKYRIEEHVKDLEKKAFFAMEEKDLPRAEKLYQEILIFQPDNPQALAQMGAIKNIKDKIEEYRKQGVVVPASTGRAFDLSAYSAISNYNRAIAFFHKGERGKAIELLNEILAKEPNHSTAFKLKEEVERVEELAKIIEKAENSLLSESMEKVIQSVTELLEKDPAQIHYYLMRAKAYMKTQQYSNARQDLLKYYSYTKDEENVFPLMAEISSIEGNNLAAIGFIFNKKLQTHNKNIFWIIKNYFYAYFWQNLFLIVVLFCMLPFAIFYTWQTGENLFLKFSIGNLKKFIKCLSYIFLGKVDKCLKELTDVARNLNYPWLNYFTGLTLLDNSELLKAQRFLKFSLSDISLKARGHYFHGIVSKLLNQNIYEEDFEQSVLYSLDEYPINIWRPKFIRRIENRLLKHYEVPDNDSLESMAHKLLSRLE